MPSRVKLSLYLNQESVAAEELLRQGRELSPEQIKDLTLLATGDKNLADTRRAEAEQALMRLPKG